MRKISVKIGFVVELVSGKPIKFLLQENKNDQTSLVAATIATEKPLSLNRHSAGFNISFYFLTHPKAFLRKTFI